MKRNMNAVRPVPTKSYLKHKLISATALLLVSAIMLVSTSYAWYVLSTAPEVSNIKTQVGANGALEIALLNKDSWTAMERLDMGDIDESVSSQLDVPAAISNLTWGNLVNLDDASYGMANIALNPARLSIMPDGEGYKINSVPLKVPIYGEDGRVKGLDKTSAVAYTYADGGFKVEDGYGVRAIGTVADMSVYQQDLNTARSNLGLYASAARTAASNTLKATGGGLATIVVDYAVNKVTEFDNDDVQSIRALAVGLQSALSEIETALRYAFAGYLTTAEAKNDGVNSENYRDKLAEVTGTTKSLEKLLEEYPGIKKVIAGDATQEPADCIEEYIEKLVRNQKAVDQAVKDCDAMIDASDAHSWEDLSKIIAPLANTDKMTVAGKGIKELKEIMASGGLGELADLLMGSGGLVVTVPTGSGVLSDIADFARDYSADVTVEEIKYQGKVMEDQTATMTTATEFDPTHLDDCGNKLRTAELAEDTGESAGITDFYGYALDLAFRTNAEESNLQLQTEPENRIYQGTTGNASLQGAGSYMSFTSLAGLSATKMVRLMSGIRVVFMDGDQQVLAIAALDTNLGKGDYTELDAAAKEETGMYAYLNGGGDDYQNSDLINKTTYDAREEESQVVFDPATGKVTAKLYLYDFEMVMREKTDAEGNTVYDEEGNPERVTTGALKLNGKAEDSAITALLQDVPQKVTALVYLDGSVVNNSSVAATASQSMTGTLNLQFSSSALLVPADVTKLQSQTYKEPTDAAYEAGYLYFADNLCKIKDGYTIYVGEDNTSTYYYTVGDDTHYTLLTTANYTNVMTPVTLAVTPSPVELTVGEKVTLTAVLSDEALKAYVVGSGNGKSTGTGEYVEMDFVENDPYTHTVTGKSAGSGFVHASVTVELGTKSYTIYSGNIPVTVTAAAGGSPEQAGTYSVTVTQSTGGTITADPTSAKEGDTVALSAIADADHTFSGWSVKDASDGNVTVTDNAFVMPASNVTVTATFTAESVPGGAT